MGENQMSKLLKRNKGFTLIELVIVIAIAALILAAVLFAVIGAQSSRRDAQRKTDAGTISSYIQQAASNYSGNLPAEPGGETKAKFNAHYITGNSLDDPSTGVAYAPTFTVGAAVPLVCPAINKAGKVVVEENGYQYLVCMGLESSDVFQTGD
jgi:prepilin-type N-terminal cleavage/methylation domain-containing protein